MPAVDADQFLRAMAVGMFPMAPDRSAETVDWIEPKIRGVMPIDGFRISRSLSRTLRAGRHAVTADQAFEAVVAGCAERTAKRQDSWISPTLQAVFGALHARGHAHSVEIWQDSRLVGGLFGTSLGAMFAAESMFSRVPDASKIAFAHLMLRLKYGGYRLVDCQFVSPHLASLGAVPIEQAAYRALLKEALLAGGLQPAAPLTPGTATTVDFFAIDNVKDTSARGGRI